MKKRKLISIFLGLGFCLSIFIVVRAFPGDLDPTFGNGGKVVTITEGYIDPKMEAFELQPDGKLVTLNRNSTGNDVILIRYLANGTLDPTFGINGVAITPSIYFSFNFKDLAFQTDGKILATGLGSTENNNVRQALLVRFLSNGALDTNFGTNGIVVFRFIGYGTYECGFAVEVQPDGAIVVAGRSYPVTSYSFGVARFNPDGTFDTTFSGDGRMIIDLAPTHDEAYDLAIQADGKIVLAGYAPTTHSAFALVRLMPNGSLDNSFSGDGKVITDLTSGHDEVYKIFITPSGKIVASGQANYFSGPSYYDLAIARYNQDGSLDTDFGSSGFTVTDINNENNLFRSAIQQWDGKTIVVFTTNGDFATIRYTDQGLRDLDFGVEGLLTTDFENVFDEVKGSLLQPDGKFILGGNIYITSAPPYEIKLGLARYETSTTATHYVCSEPVVLGSTHLQARFETPSCCNVTSQKILTYPGSAPGDPGELPVYWELSNDCSEPYSMALDFSYTEGELEHGVNVTEGNLVIFRNEGDALWTNLGGTVDTNANTVSISGITALSYWTLGDVITFGNVGPTAVQLATFTVNRAPPKAPPLLFAGLGIALCLLGFLKLRQR